MRIALAVFAGLFIACCSNPSDGVPAPTWLKGNLHTHTLWSDGDAPPEAVVDWYRSRGYRFLALSDHNILSVGEKWVKTTPEAVADLRARFGDDWPVVRDGPEMRLKTLAELRARFEKPGEFILIQAEEITDRFEKLPVHVNGINLRDLIPPQGGKSTYEVMQNNINAVRRQRDETGQQMFAHVNHPNFGWGIVAEDLIQLRGDRFFEVYNGHPGVRNWGDDAHPGTDRMWDIVLSLRLKDGRHPLYGTAVDDAHHYGEFKAGKSNPGRGWVMVRAEALTAAAIVHAMERGDFYATTGVALRDVIATGSSLRVDIDAAPDVSYRTQFIGTMTGFDDASQPILDPSGKERPHVTRRYSGEIGRLLLETTENPAFYRFTGNELYVRAKVISDRKHPNPFAEGDVETAWTQPTMSER